MAKFEKCPEKGCIHYRIYSDPTDRFPKGIVVHFASVEGGHNLVCQAERTGMISTHDAPLLHRLIDTTISLPEKHLDDQRSGCSVCEHCKAKSTFVLSPLMALEYMDPTSNEPVN